MPRENFNDPQAFIVVARSGMRFAKSRPAPFGSLPVIIQP